MICAVRAENRGGAKGSALLEEENRETRHRCLSFHTLLSTRVT